MAKIRSFFAERGVLEVETPLLSAHVSHDCHIDFFSAGPDPETNLDPSLALDLAESGFLQTSPEPHMKRLLCAGFGDIFQICKAFRRGESGKRHNPEFSMVEWYRKGFDIEQMETETLDLCQTLVSICLKHEKPVQVNRFTWEEAWEHYLGFSPVGMDDHSLRTHPLLQELGVDPKYAHNDFQRRTDIYDYFMSMVLEPRLDPKALTVIRHFPVEQAAQSLAHPDNPAWALRFEVYGGGFEIANGYQELLDGAEYRRRFQEELVKREWLGKSIPPLDENLLQALEQEGLPACAGVAVGFDRLLMFALGHSSIEDVLLFPWKHA